MARRLFLLLFVCGLTALASATKIQTSDPNQPCTHIMSGNFFGFQANGQGQGDFFFCNDTNQNWDTLLVAIQTQVPLADITCTTTAFFGCVLKSTPGVIYAYFPNPCAGDPSCSPQETGIPIGGELEIDLNCNDGQPATCPAPDSWGADAGVNTYTNPPTDNRGKPILPPFQPVPEPATITLLVTGLGAALLKRRRR